MPRPNSSFWSEIYIESIVEHDPRLRSTRTETLWINFDEIIAVDWEANNKERIASHPIAIYLNKLAPKLQQFKRKNKDLIYRRPELVASNTITFKDDREITGMRNFSKITINPRNRWFKLYERNPRLTFTTSALSTQLYRTIQARSEFHETKTRDVLIPSDKYSKRYKVRIYHRQTWNHLEEGGSFPSVWKEPDPSAWIDDVSGMALRHITLLCRDMICECNKCTTGCTESQAPRCCDACRLQKLDLLSTLFVGSFAEGCMLPTFFVRNELNEAIKIWSDIDEMTDSERRVGFSQEIESAIFATIETDDCRPGYLRLRVAGNGKIFRMAENREFLDGNALLRNREKANDDALTDLFKTTLTRGPATTRVLHWESLNMDEVYYFSCSSWPPIARTWVDRERRSKWPSKEIIQEIVSKGCRIVHKPHPSSRDPDAEFRFSFSEAELILFNTLHVDQKKCFIAFKALVKYGVCRSEIITNEDINLSSYSLKTIFLWSCEIIPIDQWHTTNGWARCLLYMIDQLYACLKSRTLPGYFIPECNLMDSIEIPQTLFQEIVKLRSNPITYAAGFLDSTRCLRYSDFKIAEDLQDFCETDFIEKIVLQRQLAFMQIFLIKLDSIRGITFWRKEAVLRIFAKWCQQNSHAIHLSSWQCLTKEMTLFDVVHLDIVHGFDVPNNVLLEYVDREWSVDVVCKLACCYSMKTLAREDQKNNVEYLLHFKTLLMIHQAIIHKYPSSETIIISVSILVRCKEYEMAARVLEPALRECSYEVRLIRCRELYADIFSHNMKYEIKELCDIQKVRAECNDVFQSNSILICFLASVCYKYIGDEEQRELMLERMSVPIAFFWNRRWGDDIVYHAYLLLMLEVLENSEKWKSLHYRIYERFVTIKIKLIEQASETMKRQIVGHRRDILRKTPYLLCSCNTDMIDILEAYFNILRKLGYFTITFGWVDNIELTLMFSISTTADIIYFSQFLIFQRKLEQAISHLEFTVEQEGDFSKSLVIWPKQLYASCLVDYNLRQELIKSSEEYVVFPSNLYARYLLSIAYSSLGQEENRINNQAELIVLRERYSRVREFAPMLKIMSAISLGQSRPDSKNLDFLCYVTDPSWFI